jgi:hypothetical protein
MEFLTMVNEPKVTSVVADGFESKDAETRAPQNAELKYWLLGGAGIFMGIDKKTIVHIPNVNSGESLKRKYDEVNIILDAIGEVEKVDSETGIIYLNRRGDGKVLKVADLVNDTPKERERIVSYLREMQSADDMDLIIALGMAKEGFDWPWCEFALTVGFGPNHPHVSSLLRHTCPDLFSGSLCHIVMNVSR